MAERTPEEIAALEEIGYRMVEYRVQQKIRAAVEAERKKREAAERALLWIHDIAETLMEARDSTRAVAAAIRARAKQQNPA